MGALGVTNFWTYVLGTVAIILLPGPNSLFVLSTGARRGVKAGYQAAAGVFLGDTVLMTLSAAGVASLLRTYPALFLVVKYAGSAYLLWVGVGILRGAVKRWRGRATGTLTVAAADGGAAVVQEKNPFRRSVMISLLNPKAILFFISFFIQFVEPGYAHPAVGFLVLGLVAQVISAMYLTALIFGGKFLAAQFRRRRKLAAGVTTGVGALFVGFSIKLATASIS